MRQIAILLAALAATAGDPRNNNTRVNLSTVRSLLEVRGAASEFYVGVFSSGFLGQGGADSAATRYAAVLSDPKFNSRVKLLWLATGKEDFILPQTKATLAVFDRNNIKYTYKESDGGHTWPNWRAYLTEFAPQLFR